MSRAALTLPSRASWTVLADTVIPTESVEGLEPFDVLAYGTAAAEQALRAVLEHGERVHALVLASAEPPPDQELTERLTTLKLPVLALFGTRAAAVPPATGRRWRAVLPGCHIVLVYDAGSDIAADRPEAFADVVLDFLADPGAFLVNRRSGVRQP